MPDDDPDHVPNPRHPSLQLPGLLSAADIGYRELHPDIDSYGQAFLPDLPPDATPDPATSPVILVRPADPEPDAILNAMRASSTDFLHSAHADDLAISAALSVCSSATILRSDPAMGQDFQSRVTVFRNGTHHLAPAQLEAPIRKGLSSALASYGDTFPVRIAPAALLGDALELEPRGHDALVTALTKPFAFAAEARPQRNPPFRIALHGNFPDPDNPEASRHAGIAATAAATLLSNFVDARRSAKTPDESARIPGSILFRTPAITNGLENTILAAIRKTRNRSISIEQSIHVSLPEPRVHLVLGDPADLPIRSRNTIARACFDPDAQPTMVAFIMPPDRTLLLYGDPATRPHSHCALPHPFRSPAWNSSTCNAHNADLIASTPGHGALNSHPDFAISNPDQLADALLSACAQQHPEAGLQDPLPGRPLTCPLPTRASAPAAQASLDLSDPQNPPIWPSPISHFHEAAQNRARRQISQPGL